MPNDRMQRRPRSKSRMVLWMQPSGSLMRSVRCLLDTNSRISIERIKMDNPYLEVPYFFARRLKLSGGQCSVCSKQTKRLRRIKCMGFYPGGASESLGDFAFCKKCQLNLQEVSLIAEEALEQMECYLPDAVRRWILTDHLVKFGQPDWDVSFPLNVFNALAEARRCFLFGFQLGCIVLSSAAVELAINSDERRILFNWTRWRNMNTDSLQAAFQFGCPINLLLNPDEIMNGTIRENPRPKFIERRNKYAHGEYVPGFIPFISVTGMEQEALDQLLKCQNFLVEWASSEGNPIVVFDKGNEQVGEQGQKTKTLQLHAPAASLRIDFFNQWTIDTWY